MKKGDFMSILVIGGDRICNIKEKLRENGFKKLSI